MKANGRLNRALDFNPADYILIRLAQSWGSSIAMLDDGAGPAHGAVHVAGLGHRRHRQSRHPNRGLRMRSTIRRTISIK
jgi:hypothetical protein